ncbi:type II toxin-antitoxin system HigB family toxin [Terracidiphilus sp.]|jgi:mRNA interferase HigB|uniref:type II toxin-antitoxin system HigB family toxin n=1 Tax=Terracidiphilus sp. TaxID=1964191 RepID=UPI003C28F131
MNTPVKKGYRMGRKDRFRYDCTRNGNVILFSLVRVFSRNTLTRYAEKLAGHKDQRAVKSALDAWFYEVREATWKSSADVKRSYSQASIVGADRIVFNVKGNSYRLVVAVNYIRSSVFIKWIGTHKEYDGIDVRTVEYGSETN